MLTIEIFVIPVSPWETYLVRSQEFNFVLLETGNMWCG